MSFIYLGQHVFDSIGIIIRPSLEKNIDPLHRTIKTRHGIPNVHIKLMFTIYMSLFSYYSTRISVFRL